MLVQQGIPKQHTKTDGQVRPNLSHGGDVASNVTNGAATQPKGLQGHTMQEHVQCKPGDRQRRPRGPIAKAPQSEATRHVTSTQTRTPHHKRSEWAEEPLQDGWPCAVCQVIADTLWRCSVRLRLHRVTAACIRNGTEIGAMRPEGSPRAEQGPLRQGWPSVQHSKTTCRRYVNWEAQRSCSGGQTLHCCDSSLHKQRDKWGQRNAARGAATSHARSTPIRMAQSVPAASGAATRKA